VSDCRQDHGTAELGRHRSAARHVHGYSDHGTRHPYFLHSMRSLLRRHPKEPGRVFQGHVAGVDNGPWYGVEVGTGTGQ